MKILLPYLLLLPLLLTFQAHAQISTPPYADNILTPSSPIGTPPGTATDGDNESVNLSNGALTVYVPLLSVPQRGGWSLPFALVNSSNGYYLQQNVTTTPFENNQDGEQDWWTTSFAYTVQMVHPDAAFENNLPRLQASQEYAGSWNIMNGQTVMGEIERYCLTNFQFTDWQGSKHPFAITQSCNQPNLANAPFRPGTIADATDGSFYRIDLTNIADIQVISKSGTVYHFYGMTNPYPDGTNDNPQANSEDWYDRRMGLMTDTNGNSISVTSSGSGFVVTDTIGRTFTFSNAGLTYTGDDGTQKSINLNWQVTGGSVNDVFSELSCSYSPRSNGSGPNPPGTCATVPAPGYESYQATVTYPPADANGDSRKLVFDLDSRQRIVQVFYPSGGYTRYDYADANVQAWSPTTITNYTFQHVWHKYECPSSSGSCSAENVTTYSGTVAVSQLGAGAPYLSTVTVTDPLGNNSVHTFGQIAPGQISPKETSVTKSDASNRLLWTQQTTYTTLGSWAVSTDLYFPQTVTTTLNDGSPAVSNTVTYSYETYPAQITGPTGSVTTYIDNPTEIDETDFGGATKRKTTEQWNPLGFFSGSSGHILDRPASKTISELVEGLQNTTTYVYDNGSNTTGNLTKKTVTATNAPSAVTQYQVNGYGEVTKITDPDQHSTQIAYNDAWANGSCAISPGSSAYPSSVTNAAGQTTSFTYNTCLGTIASVSGPNPGQTTTYTYDALQRVVSISQPDHGGKEACYFDSEPNTITTYTLQAVGSGFPACTTATAAPAGVVADSVVLDGFGRKIEAQLLSDPSGAVLTDTAYDADGNVHSVSTPYRSLSDPTYGITVYGYDGLNRKTVTVNSDQTSETWTYAGNVATFTDENSSQWQHTSDAFGNLIEVLEPDGSSTAPSMETDYSYDGLGNLWQVNQWGGPHGSSGARTRSFTYDGRSELLSATNPESGTVGYTYDANGNLLTKTDARGITITYTYDAVNRVTWKHYSDGESPVGFGYDGKDENGNPISPAPSNAIGKLSHDSNEVDAATNYSYDLMGRVVSRTVCVPGNCSYSLGATATYDLAGNMISSQLPTGVTLNPTFDGAGRLSGLSSVIGTGNPSSMFSNTIYGPIGLTEAQLGNGLREDLAYDRRARISTYSVGTTSSAPSGGTPPLINLDAASNAASGQSSVPQGGIISARGWAADNQDGAPVAEVDVLLDGVPIGLTALGGSRPDVAAYYNRPDFTNSGWSYTGSIGNVTTGQHTVTAVAHDWSGNVTTSGPVTITVTSDTPPFGNFDSASSVATGTTTVPAGGIVTASGWAADNEDGAPVSMVKVLLDGVSIGNVALGGSRPDVATAYNRPDFTNSGWSFTGSVRTASVGGHTLTAVGYDSSGNAGQIATSIPITVTADNDSFLGSLDSAASTSNPNSNSISMGDSITVQGWAAEPDANPGAPLSRVEIEIDGQLLGVATLGISRPDVATAYNRPDYANSGWSFIGPVTNVDPGEHSIGVRVYTKSGGSFLLPLLRQIVVVGTMPTISGTVTPAKYAFSVGYAPNGNVVQAGDTVNGDWSYTYDTLNRLISALSPTTGVSWTYDAFGNRWQQTATRGSAPQPQLTFFTATNRMDMECYDASGNVLDDGPCPQNTGHKYSYDAEGRLISSNFGSTTYIYDAEGNRIAKASGSTITNVYMYDTSGQTIAETDGSLNPLRTEIYAGSRHLATYQNGAFYYNHLNWLGTEAARSDASGNLCETLSSLPFGDNLQTDGTCSPTPDFFTGKERDAESGNDYFGARYYASTMGRFMSPDPLQATPERLLDPQEWNMYAYARNNPLSITDPTGLDIWLQGCGKDNGSTCKGNYVGTTDADGNFTRTHLTGDQTGDASLGTNGISVTEGGNTYQGVWDTNAGEQGAVQVAGGGDLSSFNANITGNCQGTCVASGTITNKDGSPASAGDVRAALTNSDGSAKPGWFANNNDPFHRSPGVNGKNVNDTSFNAMNPDVAGQRSTDVTVPQNPSLGVKMHVNSGYPFEDAYQMTRHVISIMHTFTNAVGITHPTTQ